MSEYIGPDISESEILIDAKKIDKCNNHMCLIFCRDYWKTTYVVT